MNKDIPAFPRPVSTDKDTDTFAPEQDGMTLRDYFAGQAMGALIAQNTMGSDEVAMNAYSIADEMLRERNE